MACKIPEVTTEYRERTLFHIVSALHLPHPLLEKLVALAKMQFHIIQRFFFQMFFSKYLSYLSTPYLSLISSENKVSLCI